MIQLVIAPDSYKGSLTAVEVASVIADAFTAVLPDVECRQMPMADGGEGTLATLLATTGGRSRQMSVQGPYGTPCLAEYGVIVGDGGRRTGVIELAQAAGLTRVQEGALNPLLSTTVGVGELMQRALDEGCRQILVGLGGSATMDGGMGLLAALGVKFYDRSGRTLMASTAAMLEVAAVDVSGLDSRLAQTRIDVACDVDNPLTGAAGASLVYGPQKGASARVIADVEQGLSRFAPLLEQALGTTGLHCAPGAGAAGGCGFALMAIGGELRAGSAIVGQAIGLDAAIAEGDLVITGEGFSDAQTLRGKVPLYVSERALAHGKPVILLSGGFDPDVQELSVHFTSLHAAATGPCSLEVSMAEAARKLSVTAMELARFSAAVWGPGHTGINRVKPGDKALPNE